MSKNILRECTCSCWTSIVLYNNIEHRYLIGVACPIPHTSTQELCQATGPITESSPAKKDWVIDIRVRRLKTRPVACESPVPSCQHHMLNSSPSPVYPMQQHPDPVLLIEDHEEHISPIKQQLEVSTDLRPGQQLPPGPGQPSPPPSPSSLSDVESSAEERIASSVGSEETIDYSEHQRFLFYAALRTKHVLDDSPTCCVLSVVTSHVTAKRV
jgi:hypothetical protein